eukprot:1608441-Pyramimonas_sp.AAC.1
MSGSGWCLHGRNARNSLATTVCIPYPIADQEKVRRQQELPPAPPPPHQRRHRGPGLTRLSVAGLVAMDQRAC